MKKQFCGVAAVVMFGSVTALEAQNLYVGSAGNGQGGIIGEYGLNGSIINASFISGLDTPEGIVIVGNDLFVANFGSGTVGEYGLDGSTINASLISGLSGPAGIAISGTNLFIATGGGTIAEYTTSGTTVNTSLISELGSPFDVVISGNDLFVGSNGVVCEYGLDGSTINASLISLSPVSATGIAISGTNMFIAHYSNNSIGEYTTSGRTINASLISGLSGPEGIAIFGNILYVVNSLSGTVGEYTTSGATINASLITGLHGAFLGIGISAAPVPVLCSSGFSNGQFQMTVTCSSNLNYAVKMTTDLLSTNWISCLVTNPPSSSFVFTDSNATNQQQFYRVEMAQ